jgi:hypothetical protein
MKPSRLSGGIVAFIGWLLSPLSWWNDAVVNLPLAWLFASAVSLISHRLFAPAMVAGYWLTNIAGLMMMSRGTADVLSHGKPRNRGRELVLSLVAATVYTGIVVLLTYLGVLRPLWAFLAR